jgi:DNA polymerase-1
MNRKEKVILVDGNSLLYRTYFALPSLTTTDGTPTGGVYGFTNLLLKLLEEERPDYIAFAFDRKGPTFRHLEFSEYKAHRPRAPSDLVAQVALTKELALVFQIPVFEKEGYEADDCIATLARRACEQGKQVIIISGDLDALQLIGPTITLLTPVKGLSQIAIYDEDAVKKRFNLSPDQFLDYKALVGDPSDNVPRIPGIGEKTAQTLLSRYGSLEGIYQHLEELEPKIKETLTSCRAQVEQNLRLSALVDNLNLEVNWNQLKVKEPDREKLFSFFSRLEFMSLIKKFAPSAPQNHLEILPFSSWVNPERPCALALVVADTPGIAIACDNEIFGEEILQPAENLSLFAQAFSLPSQVISFVEDEQAAKWVHDAKEQIKFFRKMGLELRGIHFDLMLASYLLNSSRSSHTLEQIYLERVKQPLWNEEGTFTALKKAALSACAIRDLTPILKKELQNQGLDELLDSLELPLCQILAEMELTGVKISVEVLQELRVEVERRLSALEKDIFNLCGVQFNISSPKQLGFVLFEKLQLAKGKRTKTGYSTDISVLESLRGLHPAVEKIIEHRELSKLKNTYIDAIPELIGHDGRVHTTFLQTSTATGRLSSVNPNLQNIPIRSGIGQRIRRAFVAGSAEHFLLSADYSQIELRVLAHLSGDRKLHETFASDRDIHTDTACRIYRVKESEVTPEMRRVAKTVNFGVIYGMSAYGLSQAISVSPEEAQKYIDSFFEEHIGVREYLDRVLKEGRVLGYVTTILGRRRHIPDLNSANKKLAQAAERMAINSPIQGSAADIMKLAMIKLCSAMKAGRLKSKLVLQVHDELVLDCPKEEREEISFLVRDVLSGAYPLSVSLKVELKAGNNWFEMEKV